MLGLICGEIAYLSVYHKQCIKTLRKSEFVGTIFMASTQDTQFKCTFVTEP